MGQRRSDDKIQDEIKQLQKELKLLKTLMSSKSDLLQAEEDDEKIPKLYENQPNPFEKFTIIQYYVPKTGNRRISLFIVDENGDQKMFLDRLKTGNQRVLIKDHPLTPGFYFCSLVVDGNIVETRKIEVAKEITH